MKKATGDNSGAGRLRDANAPSPRDKRPRGGDARQIADLMPSVGNMAFRKFGFVQSSIITRWPEIVGAKLARACRPESLRFARGSKANGVLTIMVGGAHAPIVQHMLPDIIARVNRFFGYAAVDKVKLVQGAIKAPEPIQRNAAAIAQSAAGLATEEASPSAANKADIATIADPELRAVLEALASSLGKANAIGKIS